MAFPRELAKRLDAIDPADPFAAGRAWRAQTEELVARSRRFHEMRERAERIFDRTMVLGGTALALAGGLITGDQARPQPLECPDGMTAVDMGAQRRSEAILGALGENPADVAGPLPGPEVVGSLNWTDESTPLPGELECVYLA